MGIKLEGGSGGTGHPFPPSNYVVMLRVTVNVKHTMLTVIIITIIIIIITIICMILLERTYVSGVVFDIV